MTTERERQNREEFLKLIQENPDIPIVPMVDGEIPGDDCGFIAGRIASFFAGTTVWRSICP